MIVAHSIVRIGDTSHPGEARRAASRMSEQLKFSDVRAGELNIVVTEMARNVLAHAQSGELLLLGWHLGRKHGIDVFALDKGPGIADFQKAAKDSYSTAGTPGNGLGAILRLSSSFDIYTNGKQGTALFARFVDKAETAESEMLLGSCPAEVGCVIAPVAGESVSGDSVCLHLEGSRCLCIAVDGLGHGVAAAEAAETAIQIFHENSGKSPEKIVHRLHLGMRATRGAAIAIAELDFRSHQIRYCGVGNISGIVLSDAKSQSLMSHNGTVGHIMGRTAEFLYDFPDRALLIMHSDGIQSQWDISKYAGLGRRHPSLIAGILYRDFKRGRDDASVLVLRENAENQAA